MGGFAWVTLATNDSYSLGALVLAHSLRQNGTPHQLVVLVTPGVTSAMREKLAAVFNVVQEVNILDSKDEANLKLLKRPELGITFTKLHCWRLTQFEKCVFLDADTLVLGNADELFEREEFSAAPDVGWPDCFNSGVFVYRPSNDTYNSLVNFALEKGSFDGGDQGLLNLYFSDWAHKDISKHLPFIYNMCSTACYSYLPAFKQFGADVKIVHFIGATKPWLQYFDTESGQVQPGPGLQHLQGVLQRWWDIFFSLIQPNLTADMAPSKSPAVHNYPSPPIDNPPRSYPPQHYDSEYFSELTITDNSQQTEHDYTKVWDPWEDYENNTIVEYKSEHVDYVEPSSSNNCQSQNNNHCTEPITEHTFQPFESHNTNAHYVDAYKYPEPEIRQSESFAVVHSEKQFYTPPSTNDPPQSRVIEHVEPVVYVNEPSRPPILPTPTHDHVHHTYQSHIPATPNVEYSSTNIQPSTAQSRDAQPSIVQPSNVQPTNVQSSNFQPNTAQPSNIQNPALPHEFEPTCTVASESTLHDSQSGSHNSNDDAGLAAAFSQLKLGEPRSPGQLALEDHLRRQGWEVGNIDYLGKDSFDNIWKKICQTIDSAPAQPPPKPRESTPPSAPASVEQDPEARTQKQKTPPKESAEAVQPPAAPAPAEKKEEAPAAPQEIESKPAAPEATEQKPEAAEVKPESAAAPAPTEAAPVAAPAEGKPKVPEESAVPPPSAPAAVPESPKAESAVPEPSPAPVSPPEQPESPKEPAPAVPQEPAQPEAPAEPPKPAEVPVEPPKPSEAPAAIPESPKPEAPTEVLPQAPPSEETKTPAPEVPPEPKEVPTATPAPAEKPAEPTERPQSAEKPIEPVPPTEKPTQPVPIEKPAEPIPPTEKPAEPIPAPEKPVEPAPPAEKPVEPTPPSEKPAQLTEAPTQSAEQPSQPQPVEKPQQPAEKPAEKSSKPAEKSAKPAEKSSKPAEKAPQPGTPEVTSATPPTSPPVQPQVKPEAPKSSLGVKAAPPETPPPEGGAGAAEASPTPPPRKAGGGAKKGPSKGKK